MYGRIYLRRNKIENKDYVGQTTQQGDARWKQHVSDAHSRRTTCSFSIAIVKFGAAAFDELILAYAKDQEELDFLEILFIEALKTANPLFGYNDKDGGNGGKLTGYIRGKLAFKARERASRLSQLKPKTINNLAFRGDIYQEQKEYSQAVKLAFREEKCKVCNNMLQQPEFFIFCSNKCRKLYSEQVKLFESLVPKAVRASVMKRQQLYFKQRRIYKNSSR